MQDLLVEPRDTDELMFNNDPKLEGTPDVETLDTYGAQLMASLRHAQDDKWLNFTKALYVAACFLLLFIAFNSVQNITTEIYHRNGFGSFGFVCLGVFYATVGITALLSSAIVARLGVRNSMVVGAAGHFIFIFS